ncbi:hypothetical protein SGLAM104S_09466 [Streptomyces glaucescens]
MSANRRSASAVADATASPARDAADSTAEAASPTRRGAASPVQPVRTRTAAATDAVSVDQVLR